MNEPAIKARLKSISIEKGVSFNEIWKQFLLERFLARLSHSKHHRSFIFKGGLLLAQYLPIGRETTDADFLTKGINNDAPSIENKIREILDVTIDDGFEFSWSRIEELTQPHMAYPGFRVVLNVTLEKMRDKIQLDIGAGDLVNAVSHYFHALHYRGKPIIEGEISLLVYPIETIFSEKLETIVSKGAVNSRMKDYHDALLIVRSPHLLDNQKTGEAIRATFKNRSTILSVPITFDNAGMETLQKLWGSHLRSLGEFTAKLELPERIDTVLQEINEWLSEHSIETK